MNSKSKTAFWIRRTGRAKLEDTAPEGGFDEFVKWAGIDGLLEKPQPVRDESGDWTFRPDRYLAGIWQTYYHIDGPSHWSPWARARDDWQDRTLRLVTGKRTLRIDSPLLEKRLWPHVLSCVVYARVDPFMAKSPPGFAWTSPDHRSARLYA